MSITGAPPVALLSIHLQQENFQPVPASNYLSHSYAGNICSTGPLGHKMNIWAWMNRGKARFLFCFYLFIFISQAELSFLMCIFGWRAHRGINLLRWFFFFSLPPTKVWCSLCSKSTGPELSASEMKKKRAKKKLRSRQQPLVVWDILSTCQRNN